MLLDESIHAARVRLKQTARRRIDKSPIPLGRAPETERAKLLINIDCGCPENFRKLSGRAATDPSPEARKVVYEPPDSEGAGRDSCFALAICACRKGTLWPALLSSAPA